MAISRLVAAALLSAAGAGSGAVPARHWIATWTTAPMAADAGSAIPDATIRDATVRQFLRISVGGTGLRLRVTNRFGTAPLRIDRVRIALGDPGESGAILVATDRPVTFGGAAEAVIPAGADYLSDPVDLAVKPLATVAATMHFRDAPAGQTIHYVSNSTSYVARGAATTARILPDAARIEHWFQLAGVDVKTGPAARAVAVLGDSITDGHASGVDRNERWTDILASRLQADPGRRNVSVLNLGISGNRLIKNGSGPNGMARFGHDILDQPGLATLVVLEGTNDLGKLSREGPVTPAARARVVAGVIAAYRQLIAQAHLRGIRVVGGTLLPFAGTRVFRSDADATADRDAVNAWIRAPGHFDAVIDFAAAVRDPAHPERLRPDFDSGDMIHPSPAGYRAMGAAVPLAVVAP